MGERWIDGCMTRALGVPAPLARELRESARRSVPEREYALRLAAFLVGASRPARALPAPWRERAVGPFLRPALIGGPTRLAYAGLRDGDDADPCGTLRSP